MEIIGLGEIIKEYLEIRKDIASVTNVTYNMARFDQKVTFDVSEGECGQERPPNEYKVTIELIK